MENPFEAIDARLQRIESLLEHIIANAKIVAPDKNFEVMTIEQLSELINLAVTTIYGLVHRRTIPHYKKGKRLYFNRTEIDEWLIKGKRLTTEELNQRADEYIFRNPI